MSCGVGRRLGSDPALLWLWRRLVAAAPIRPLAWEPPYAAGAAQEIATTTTKKKNTERVGEKTVTAMYTSKDDLTPLLYSGKIIKKKKKKKKRAAKMEVLSYGK